MDQFVLQKQIELQKNIQKTVIDFEKGGGNKGFPPGTIRYWNGYRYKKKIDGSWVYSPEDKKTSNEDKEGKKLTDEESLVISQYTNMKYREINQYMRGEIEGDMGIIADVNNLKNGLNKFSSYGKYTYRVIEIKNDNLDNVYDKYKNAQNEDFEIEFDAFLSTSKDKEIANNLVKNEGPTKVSDTFNKGILFIIDTKNNESKGKNIENYSILPVEQEVLFEPNSKFKVNDVDIKEEDNLIEITLDEI